MLLRPLADPIGWDYPFTVEGQSSEAQARNPHANYESVSPSYFSTMRIPLVQGRVFSHADGPDAGQVAVVSASMARRFWPHESALGKRLKAGPPDSKQPWKTVVGVVGDVRYREWTAVRADFYVPYSQWNFGRMDLVVRAQGDDPLAVVPAVRASVRDADPEIALATVSTMSKAVEEATAGPRFTAVLLVALACIALVVAAVGTFSVLAWSVERRTREFGVRIALGANRAHVLRLVLGQAVVLTGLGVVSRTRRRVGGQPRPRRTALRGVADRSAHARRRGGVAVGSGNRRRIACVATRALCRSRDRATGRVTLTRSRSISFRSVSYALKQRC